jgi:ribosomal protein S27E
MPYICPSCKNSSIAFWQKYISAPLFKVTCKECGAKIYAGGTVGILISGVSYLVLLYLAFLTVLYQDLIHSIYFNLAWVISDILHLAFAPLVISKAGTKNT